MIGSRLWGALGALLLLPGCGGGGAAGPDGGSDASADVGASCSTLVPDGAPTVSTTVMQISAPPEAPAGGTITDGVYFRTASIFYVPTCNVLPGAPSATAVRLTVTSATAGVMDIAQGITVPGEQYLSVSSSSYTVDGTTMTRTVRCYTLNGADITAIDGGIPAGDVTSSAYTATPTEIRLYTDLVFEGGTNCGTEVAVLQKR